MKRVRTKNYRLLPSVRVIIKRLTFFLGETKPVTRFQPGRMDTGGQEMRIRLLAAIAGVLLVAGAMNVAAFDVSVKPPNVSLLGDLATAADLAGIDVDSELNEQLGFLATQFETELADNEDLARFSTQKDLTRGFANAGATAAHLGTQRSFIDYRRFAFVVGTGASISAPGITPDELENAASNIEEEGDIYFGTAIQPISASLGINLSRWVDGLRANVKVGYANIAAGTISDEIGFESISIGVGASYQVLQSRSLPLGIIRWRGLSVASGFNFQRNTTEIEIAATGEDGFEAGDVITFGDLGFTTQNLDDAGIAATADDPFGTLTVAPSLLALIESRTYSIPLEVNTGIRFLYLIDVNVGAGIDLSMGSSEVSVGAKTDVDFKASPEAEQYIDFAPGQANLGIKTTNDPQFVRPRVTAGVGVNLGPIKLDVPLMYYFDADGPGAMVGVNVGIVW